MTDKKTTVNRAILVTGGVAALALVILGIFNQSSYSSIVAAAIVWSLASLSMIALGIAFIHIRRVFETPAAYLASAVLFIKAVLVVIPLFVEYADAEVMQVIRSAIDILFMAATAWVMYCGRPLLGGIVSRLIAAMLTIASLGLIAKFIVAWWSIISWQSCVESALVNWAVILSTLLGTGGMGASFIWLGVRRGEGAPADAA